MQLRVGRVVYSTLWLLCALCSSCAWAAKAVSPSAELSDPRALQWMIGSPPPVEKLIMQPQSNYFSFPKLRWTVCHLRELLPTKQVSRGLGAPIVFDYELDSKIGNVSFKTSDKKREVTFEESLLLNYTDGILVLHKGKIVYEKYAGCLDESSKHAAMSMTKSLVGLLAEILIAEGLLEETAKVSEIIPELKGSAFGSASVRQIMDMTTALAYSEDYSDLNADIWVYSAAASPLPKPEGYKGPNGYYEYLQTVRQQGEHGYAFGYKTINTDVLGWIISRVAKQNLTTLLSQKIWRKLGAEQDAYMTIDGLGTPFAGGGLSAGLRDLGRIGQLMLNKGMLNGVRVFPESVVNNIKKGGDKAVFDKAGFDSLKGGSYRSMWWVLHNKHHAYAARGVHGQTIYIDPIADMVIVRFASFPEAKNSYSDPTSLPAYQALAEYLLETH